MSMLFEKKGAILFLVVAVIISGFIGFSIGKNQQPPLPIQGVSNLETGKPAGVDFSLFWDAWRELQAKSVQTNLDVQKMVYGAISGMVSSLDDPYTVFMDPKTARKFLDDVSGSFEGVGMEIGIKQKQLQVIAPLPGTPAQQAGLKAGDQILKIDTVATDGMAIDEAVSRIRGPRGSSVTLSIFRDGWKQAKDFVITRDTIEVPSLKWEIKNGNIAYIQLYQFSEKAGNDFRKAASEIVSSGAAKIVLDLRNDPGGYLEVAQDIAGWFLSKGKTVVIEDFGTHQKQNVYKAEGNGVFASYPVVVLINEGSASAAEILAGALRDDRGITLVGTKSFGKGSVQELTDLKDGSSLKITIANWLTPRGISISKTGLTPDVKIEISEQDVKDKKDPQFDKALELLKVL